jgi:1-acyl-sn-glycerol-3-phosphate acyltransferase
VRHLLAPLRALLLLLHILDGLAISALLFPVLSPRARNRIIRAWSRGLLSLCGARLVVGGVGLEPELARDGFVAGRQGRLVLANHISWIDVFALLGTVPARFVAKSEIGDWPLLGSLVTLVGTLYIERGRRHAVAAMNHRVRDHLNVGETIVVFAEGTTTDGFSLLPFHSNLIAPALEVGCEIWPIALRYTECGRQTGAAAFVGEMGLLTSLWNILVASDLAIEVVCLRPLAATRELTRHHLARQARHAIAQQLGMAAATPLHAAGESGAAAVKTSADTPPERVPAAASASQ